MEAATPLTWAGARPDSHRMATPPRDPNDDDDYEDEDEEDEDEEDEEQPDEPPVVREPDEN
jgi:hypothetical protein